MSSIHLPQQEHSAQIALIMVVLSLIGFAIFFTTLASRPNARIDLRTGHVSNRLAPVSAHATPGKQ